MNASVRSLAMCVCLLLAGAVPARAGFQPMVFVWDSLDAEAMERRASSPLPHVNPDAPRGGLLRMTGSGSFDNFNGFSHRGLPAGWLRLTYETLAVSDGCRGGGMRGLLAEGFEVAPDRSWMTVRLRPGARFADGHPVTAEDVRFSFEALTTQGSPTWRSYYAGVERVEVLSALEARFHFRERGSRELPLIVSQLPVLPAHWWRDRSLADPQPEPMPGSGPYRLASFEMGDHVVYERRPDWWGRDLPVNRGMYNFDAIRVDYYRNMDVAREAFLAGQSDVFLERTMRCWASSYDTPAVRGGRILREELPLDRPQGMNGFFFNMRRGKFSDRRLRRAIGLCLDFEWFNRTFFHDACTRCDSFFSHSPLAAPAAPPAAETALLRSLGGAVDAAVFGTLPEWPRSDGSGFMRDRLREIVRLLAEAGWRWDRGRMVDAQGRPFTFSLLIASPNMERVALPLRRSLMRVGVVMDVELVDQVQYVNRVRQFDFDMVVATVRQNDSPGSEQRHFWGSAAARTRGSRNYAGISDPAVDELIERLVNAATREEQVTVTHALDRVLQHGCYVIPGWYARSVYVARWAGRVAHPDTPPRDGVNLLSWWSAEAADGDGSAR